MNPNLIPSDAGGPIDWRRLWRGSVTQDPTAKGTLESYLIGCLHQAVALLSKAGVVLPGVQVGDRAKWTPEEVRAVLCGQAERALARLEDQGGDDAGAALELLQSLVRVDRTVRGFVDACPNLTEEAAAELVLAGWGTGIAELDVGGYRDGHWLRAEQRRSHYLSRSAAAHETADKRTWWHDSADRALAELNAPGEVRLKKQLDGLIRDAIREEEKSLAEAAGRAPRQTPACRTIARWRAKMEPLGTESPVTPRTSGKSETK